ncbi:MAG: thioesterase family protein [Sphingomonadaceae bacterium]|nr:thioesterase family protein [Sphingomonadaceae bacterium]
MPRIAPELLDTGRYPFVHEVATRFADVDPNWHINNVAMAAAFEDARARFMRSIGVHDALNGMRILIVSAHYEYLAEAHYPQPIVVHVGVVGRGRTSWTVGQVAVQAGQACGYCQATFVALDDAGPAVPHAPIRDALDANIIRPSAGLVP